MSHPATPFRRLFGAATPAPAGVVVWQIAEKINFFKKNIYIFLRDWFHLSTFVAKIVAKG